MKNPGFAHSAEPQPKIFPPLLLPAKGLCLKLRDNVIPSQSFVSFNLILGLYNFCPALYSSFIYDGP